MTVVWLLQAVPVGGGTFGQVPVEDSLYGALSRALAPLFTGAGFGHWELVSALAVGFVAKEAVISSWAQTFAVADPGAVGSPGALGDALHTAFAQSSGGHPTAAVAAFMVFLLAYTPCMATLAAQKREVGLRWTVVGFGLQLAVAWVLAVLVFQVGSRLG
ncbi:MAG: nucleoside recognition domain-containing protein [Nocardioides sp.]